MSSHNGEPAQELTAEQEFRVLAKSLGDDLNEDTGPPWPEKKYDMTCRIIPKTKTNNWTQKLPRLANLLYPRRTGLSELMENIPKPEGYLPKMHMPAWKEMSLDQKLPLIPFDDFIFSRGKLNQSLHRYRKRYITNDPYNCYNYLPATEYNALHDPSTQRYFNRPTVKKILLQQGLVTEDGEVICTQKDINDYRLYLKHSLNNKVIKELDEQAEKEKYQRSLNLELLKYQANTDSEHNMRRQLIKEKLQHENENRIRALRAKIKQDLLLAKRNREQLQKCQAFYRAQDKCEEYKRKQKHALALESKDKCAHAIYEEKLAKAELMAYVVKIRKELVRKIGQSDFIVARSKYQKRQIEVRKQLEKRLKEEHEKNQEEYQDKMEKRRERFPMLIEKRKEYHEHMLAVMRKYFNKWRAYVNCRRTRRPDENHLSTWDVANSTQTTVNTLQEMSGREKFDHFILNLIKMKHDMAEKLQKDMVDIKKEREEIANLKEEKREKAARRQEVEEAKTEEAKSGEAKYEAKTGESKSEAKSEGSKSKKGSKPPTASNSESQSLKK